MVDAAADVTDDADDDAGVVWSKGDTCGEGSDVGVAVSEERKWKCGRAMKGVASGKDDSDLEDDCFGVS